MHILSSFIIYSFLGWVTEVAYQAVKKGIVVNRGFLNGPVCPIYGFGVMGIFITLESIFRIDCQSVNFVVIFLYGIFLATCIELFGGWILDKCFHARWWDYSQNPFNFHGYICLEFSILWGLGIVLVVRDINPMIQQFLRALLQYPFVHWVVALTAILYILDFIVSVFIIVGLNKRFAELDEMRNRMRVVSDELSHRIGNDALDTAAKLDNVRVQSALAKAEFKDVIRENRQEFKETKEELSRLRNLKMDELTRELEERKQEWEHKKTEFYASYHQRKHFGFGRVLRAFPKMKPRDYGAILEEIRNQYHID